MVRVAALTDPHANLPALQAVPRIIRKEGCDAVFHTGDAIGIGPYPAEALELLLSVPNVHCVRGNHDSYLIEGLPEPRPGWMSE